MLASPNIYFTEKQSLVPLLITAWRLNAEVRLREFRVNGTPKHTNFLAVSQD